jgi:uncharacterized LabA/DUF88 family protein
MALPSNVGEPGLRVAVRLYGGWFEQSRLTKRAQDLLAEMAKSFPMMVQVGRGEDSRKTIVQVTLARALVVEPQYELPNTYRLRGVPPLLSPAQLPLRRCANMSHCRLVDTLSLLATGLCPGSGCSVPIDRVMTKPEQKLVDTMLTADLVSLSHSSCQVVVVVSTDDDLLPGIRVALHQGLIVHHVHTDKSRRTPKHYLRGIGENYHQYSI